MDANYIYWTRSRADWSKDERLFEQSKFKALSIPCVAYSALKRQALAGSPKDIIITSPRTIEFILKDPELCTLVKSQQCHCFGSVTAETLRSLGAKVQVYSASTSEEMGRSIEAKGPYLYIGPETPAHDLKSQLEARGFKCQSIAIYRTTSKVAKIPSEAKPLGRKLKGIVCFGSPSAVTAFKEAFDCEGLIAVVIGKTTATACGSDFKRLEVTLESTFSALAQLACETANSS